MLDIHMWGYMHINMPLMKSLVPTTEQGALYTYLTYNTEHIWLLYPKYSSNGKHAKWAYRLNIFAHIYQNTTKSNFSFICYCQVCARNKYAHQI